MHFEELRRVVASISPTKEVLLDLLFTLVQDLAWNPDYLPRTARGLPVIEIEAPRLLLFEVDRVLNQQTKGSFVRWMDDINFGVQTRDDAHRILGELNDVLKSRELELNLGKTEILTSKDVRCHFLVKENLELDRYEKRTEALKSIAAKMRFGKRVSLRLQTHIRDCKAKNRDKLTKRFLGVLSKLGSEEAPNCRRSLSLKSRHETAGSAISG